MTKSKQRQIQVYMDSSASIEPQLMGLLYAAPARGKEVFSFEYDPLWLSNNIHPPLDPSLQLFSGLQYAPVGQENFGIFLDSSPDRWGRFLMNRREAQFARVEGRKEQGLLESDYLLGVYDQHRMGALRFKTNPKGAFLNDNAAYAAPPWTSLRELEYASLGLERDDAEENPNYSSWLQMLIAPGGSLGGARPKASVLDEHQHLWIAKFPSGNDDNDVGAWEMLATRLAEYAKITTAPALTAKFNSSYHTFLTKRFDRTAQGGRIHFASVMTLLQYSDGTDAAQGASYLELAEFIMKHGAQADQDLEQLWRRIVFYICISNVDDHLRNHGFILQPEGWVLSPAFDMNPVANGNGLKLNISATDNSQDLDLVREVASYFRVRPPQADVIIKEVTQAVKEWRNEANKLGLSKKAQSQMARAFRVADGYSKTITY